MKLIYNGVDLAALATHCRILQQTTVREPPEAPQRERVTMRVRLDFFEQRYLDNQSLIQQARAALKTQQAVLLWQDDSGEIVEPATPHFLPQFPEAGRRRLTRRAAGRRARRAAGRVRHQHQRGS